MIKDDENTASRFATIIPAEPGWQIAICLEAYEEEPHRFVYEHVVAWEIQRERRSNCAGRFYVRRHVIPLTIDGDEHDEEDFWLKRPDGLFDQPYNTAGGCTEQEALASCSKRHREDAEREKRKAGGKQ
jgi:hypothetical protein